MTGRHGTLVFNIASVSCSSSPTQSFGATLWHSHLNEARVLLGIHLLCLAILLNHQSLLKAMGQAGLQSRSPRH